MTSPITVDVQARHTQTLQQSPLGLLLVVPKIDRVVTDANAGTIGSPTNEIVEITAANADTMLGTVPSASPETQTPISRAAYDHIEAGASVRVWALAFAVDPSDSVSARAGKVAAALAAVRGSAAERAKLPRGGPDIVVLPRETAVADPGTVIAALTAFCSAPTLECIAYVDAGDAKALPTARPAGAAPSQADTITWGQTHGAIQIYGVGNRAHVAHYDSMWGSVIAAAHHARYAAARGAEANPYNLISPVSGVSDITPVRELDLYDGSSPAVVLDAQANVSSVVTAEGGQFIWGGLSRGAGDDPRERAANHIVANRSLTLVRQAAVRVVRTRMSGSDLQGLRVEIDQLLQSAYVPDAVEEVSVETPTLEAGVLTVDYALGYPEYVEQVRLQAEVYVA